MTTTEPIPRTGSYAALLLTLPPDKVLNLAALGRSDAIWAGTDRHEIDEMRIERDIFYRSARYLAGETSSSGLLIGFWPDGTAPIIATTTPVGDHWTTTAWGPDGPLTSVELHGLHQGASDDYVTSIAVGNLLQRDEVSRVDHLVIDRGARYRIIRHLVGMVAVDHGPDEHFGDVRRGYRAAIDVAARTVLSGAWFSQETFRLIGSVSSWNGGPGLLDEVAQRIWDDGEHTPRFGSPEEPTTQRILTQLGHLDESGAWTEGELLGYRRGISEAFPVVLANATDTQTTNSEEAIRGH